MNKRTPERLLRPVHYDADRFVDRILIMPNGCWEWQGSMCHSYGSFCVGGKNLRPHRWSYEWLVGDIPDGLVLDHLCRNTVCVNPAHLEPVTSVENIKRGIVGEHNRIKTHCPRGHAYDAETKKGYKRCKTCERAAAKRWSAANPEKVKAARARAAKR